MSKHWLNSSVPVTMSGAESFAAFHESGHAVVALLLRRRFTSVCLERLDHGHFISGGHVQVRSVNYRPFVQGSERRTLEREVDFYLGGRAAVMVHLGRVVDEADRTDLIEAHEYLKRLGFESEDDRRGEIERRLSHLVKVLGKPPIKTATEQLAIRLHQQKRMGYKDVRLIVDLALGLNGMALAPTKKGYAPRHAEWKRRFKRREYYYDARW